MPLKTVPLNNNVLIEVLKTDDGVYRSDDTESLKFGRAVAYSSLGLHITASAGLELSPESQVKVDDYLESIVGKVVRWEEFAEGGQTFVEDSKTYALIPWWRLISVEEK
jgi:hypothetical protein